jgi:hypothetical protein
MSADLQVQPGWLTSLREAGKAGFTGLPTQRQEAWKYTGLNKLKALTFEPAPRSASPLEGEPDDAQRRRVGGMAPSSHQHREGGDSAPHPDLRSDLPLKGGGA